MRYVTVGSVPDHEAKVESFLTDSGICVIRVELSEVVSKQVDIPRIAKRILATEKKQRAGCLRDRRLMRSVSRPCVTVRPG